MSRPCDRRRNRVLPALLYAGLLPILFGLMALPALADDDAAQVEPGPAPPTAEVDDLACGEGTGGGGGSSEGDPDDPLDFRTPVGLDVMERLILISVTIGL